MKALKIFSIAGLVLVAAAIICQIIFHLPMGGKFVASICAVLGVVVAAQMVMNIDPQNLKAYNEKKAGI